MATTARENCMSNYDELKNRVNKLEKRNETIRILIKVALIIGYTVLWVMAFKDKLGADFPYRTATAILAFLLMVGNVIDLIKGEPFDVFDD